MSGSMITNYFPQGIKEAFIRSVQDRFWNCPGLFSRPGAPKFLTRALFEICTEVENIYWPKYSKNFNTFANPDDEVRLHAYNRSQVEWGVFRRWYLEVLQWYLEVLHRDLNQKDKDKFFEFQSYLHSVETLATP